MWDSSYCSIFVVLIGSQRKIAQDRVQPARKNLFKTIAIGELELNTTDSKGGRVSISWGKLVDKY